MRLTRKQQVCIVGVALGYKQEAIAIDLGISAAGVEDFLARASRKLGIRGQVALTKWAVTRGLVPAISK